MKQSNYRQQSLEDRQTTLPMSSKNAYHQSAELSSKDEYCPGTTVTLLQIDLSKFPDGTWVVQVHPYVVLDIPDSYFERFQDLRSGKIQHKIYIEVGYLSAEHRREQLICLNGR